MAHRCGYPYLVCVINGLCFVVCYCVPATSALQSGILRIAIRAAPAISQALRLSPRLYTLSRKLCEKASQSIFGSPCDLRFCEVPAAEGQRLVVMRCNLGVSDLVRFRA